VFCVVLIYFVRCFGVFARYESLYLNLFLAGIRPPLKSMLKLCFVERHCFVLCVCVCVIQYLRCYDLLCVCLSLISLLSHIVPNRLFHQHRGQRGCRYNFYWCTWIQDEFSRCFAGEQRQITSLCSADPYAGRNPICGVVHAGCTLHIH
jgi:hypothetical protein